MILALVATFLLCIAVIFAAVGSLKAEAARLFVVGLLFSAGLSIVPVFILRYLDRRERESPWLFAIAIMWGAVIATGIALLAGAIGFLRRPPRFAGAGATRAAEPQGAQATREPK